MPRSRLEIHRTLPEFRDFGRGVVAPALHTGAYPQDAADELRADGITTVVDLGQDLQYGRGWRPAAAAPGDGPDGVGGHPTGAR